MCIDCQMTTGGEGDWRWRGGFSTEVFGADLWKLFVSLGKAPGLSSSSIYGDGKGVNTCNASFLLQL